MEQQKLPNVTISIVLGILSFLCCCFSAGIGGVIMSGIALYLINKDSTLYNQNPEDYSNFSTLKTAKIVAMIGLVLGVLTLLYSIYSIYAVGGWDAYMEQQKEAFELLGIELE